MHFNGILMQLIDISTCSLMVYSPVVTNGGLVTPAVERENKSTYLVLVHKYHSFML